VRLDTGRLISHYRLVERLGEGGMGVVWKALDTTLAREVALKLLPPSLSGDPEHLEMFEREARALASLNHPNIVTVFSVEEAEGHRFLTMELVRGRTLGAIIPVGGMPLRALLEIAVPLTDAIDAAHRRGIAHRDLKPGNIMVSDEARVKVLDFGLATVTPARALVDAQDLPTWSTGRDLGFGGTVYYMSPEQLEGRDVDHRADIFALGLLLYEMATGQRPFQRQTPAAVIAATIRDEAPAPTRRRPDLPPLFDRIVAGCLAKDPDRRTQSALDVGHALRRIWPSEGADASRAQRSVAVLPFTDLSPERDQGYFCEGIAEEILTALHGVRGLRVASRPSAFRLKASGADARAIGEELGVNALLDGSVRKAGDRVRITVELVDVGDGFRLWSERYDRELRDIFAVQDDIARRVAEALEITLTSKERDAFKRPATSDLAAYDFYLRGRQFYYLYNRRGVTFARDLFSRAIELDATYARAHAGVADCECFLYLYAGRDPARLEAALASSRRAIEIAPDLAEAHASRGVALSLTGQHAEAEAAFEQSIRINPDLFEAHYFYARDSFAQGKLERAIQQYEEASRVRPDDYQSPLLVAQSLADLGRTAEAEAARRRGVRIVEDHIALNPDDSRALYMAANGLVALGDRERGLEWAARARALDPDDPMLLYNVGCIYSLAGDVDSALDCLELAVQNGLRQRAWLEHDSNLDPLRGHARFEALMQRLA